MGSKLRKKNHTFDFVKVRATKEDKAIMCLSNHMQYMIYLALYERSENPEDAT